MNDKEHQTFSEKKHKPTCEGWTRRLLLTYRRVTRYGQHRILPGVRSVLGIVLVLGSLLGFLPILGFWMIL